MEFSSEKDTSNERADNYEQTNKKKSSMSQNKEQNNEIIIEKIYRMNLDIDIVKYIKTDFLGEGGYAKCYKFIKMENGKSFAGKVIPKSSLKEPKKENRLIKEIMIHKKMHHPNIVKFEHFFEDGNNVYILLELCENKTMDDLLKTRKNLTELEVQYYIIQLIQALRYVHSKRIIHRNLKLKSLYLTEKMAEDDNIEDIKDIVALFGYLVYFDDISVVLEEAELINVLTNDELIKINNKEETQEFNKPVITINLKPIYDDSQYYSNVVKGMMNFICSNFEYSKLKLYFDLNIFKENYGYYKNNSDAFKNSLLTFVGQIKENLDLYEKDKERFKEKSSQTEKIEEKKIAEKDLADIFITSQAYLTEEKPDNILNEYTEEGITVWVVKAEGEKCERCWKFRKLGAHAGHETLCSDCYEAISE